MVNRDNVAIVSTTFYNDSEEGRLRKGLAENFFRQCVEGEYQVFVVDGGTDDGDFLEELRKLGVSAFEETQHGLGPSRREALKHASNYFDEKFGRKMNVDDFIRKNIVAWSEPEKVDYVRLLPRLLEEFQSTEADILVPTRKSLDSYPTAQQHSETFGNQRHTDHGYIDSSGKPLDTFFGPKIWNLRANPLFTAFENVDKVAQELAQMRIEETEKVYGTLSDEQKEFEVEKATKDLVRRDHMIQMPICLGVLSNGKSVSKLIGADDPFFGAVDLEYEVVSSSPVDYVHPQEQTAIEERNQAVWNAKRMAQLGWLEEQFSLVRRLHEKETLDEHLTSAVH
ncbi:hypothetical protein J4462_03150 [Candidatus Pacearchaeota archaeon]|nr:hypothetical protein [Candidatus Pacearchaeota archaeon]